MAATVYHDFIIKDYNKVITQKSKWKLHICDNVYVYYIFVYVVIYIQEESETIATTLAPNQMMEHQPCIWLDYAFKCIIFMCIYLQ